MTAARSSTVRRLRAAGLAVLIAGFLVAACYGIVDAAKQLFIISGYFQTSSWIVAQVQAEYLRFNGAVSAFWAEPSAATKGRMLERLDVFWSRLPIALEGDESRQVRRIPGATATLKSILDDLPNIESELRALQVGDTAGYHRVLEHLDRYRQPLTTITQAMMIGDKAGPDEAELRRGGIELVLSFLAVAAAGGVFIALVLQGKRQNKRLYLQARDSAQQLDLVKSQLVDAIESISESFALFDRNERLVLANTRFKEFHGGGDLLRPGATLEDVLRADTAHSPIERQMSPAAWIEQRLAQCRNPGAPFELVLAGGRTIRVSDQRTSQGGYVSVGADITDKKAAEKLLEDRLAAIEASLDGIAILDRDGRYMYLNRSHVALHGYDSAAQLIGQSWQRLYGDDEQRRFEQTILPQLRASRSWRGDAIGRHRDGTTFPQELSLTALDDGSLVSVVRDATERRRADEERTRLLEQFHFAQRSEALGRLAGGIAHDFNNILGIMTGFTELSLLDLGDEHPVKSHLDKVLSAGRRAKSLVQQILAYSRQSGSNRQPMRMDLLVKETASLLRATLPATITLSKRIGGAGILVRADASQIDQIVMNLCVNAMHAIGDRRGRIEIGLEDCQTAGDAAAEPATVSSAPSAMPVKVGKGSNGTANRMRCGQFATGRYLRLTVRDDGCGMDASTLKRIFDPFFTTKPTGTGTGLGLAAVLGIVSEHNGAIAVETEPGAGTTFEIYLPVCEDPEATDKTAVRRAPKAAQRATVLVVDDEKDLASMTCAMLQALGYSAVSCTSAATALSIIRDDPFAIDLLITDQTMPGMTGDELAANVKGLRLDLPIILCTGYSARLSEAVAREVGAHALLLKPLSRDELGQAVAQALQSPSADRPAAQA